MSPFGGLAALLAGLAFAVVSSPVASAQTLASAFSPIVTPGERTWQMRTAFTVAGDGREDRAAFRFNYDHALNTRRRLRGQVVATDRGPNGMEFSFFQAELLWEVTPETNRFWRSAVRFDARIADGPDPEQLGFNWTNQFNLGDGWRARASLLNSVQLGDQARDGVFLQTRASLVKQRADGWLYGVEAFNLYGSTSALAGFNDQTHQIGPVVGGRFNKQWSWYSGVLAGVSDRAPDADIRFWLTRSLN
ncbi:hypothetical protein GC169_08755 [bacterium]|nr:hypothetical protein [bacterium]